MPRKTTEQSGRHSPLAMNAAGNRRLAIPLFLTINGGSSSIKFALFQSEEHESAESIVWLLQGIANGIGVAKGAFAVKGSNKTDNVSRPAILPAIRRQWGGLMDWIEERIERGALTAVGHRMVHELKYWQPQRITPEMLAELRSLSPFDPEHLIGEIELAEPFHRRLPAVPQIACFDTAFHHDMPRVARLLPIPRRSDAKGVLRFGFHDLPFALLTRELGRVAGAQAMNGRVILAHLGSGASIAAVLGGRSRDTTTAFTPAAGLVMGNRSGDIDPGLVSFLARSETDDRVAIRPHGEPRIGAVWRYRRPVPT
jgi:acetate kinase